MYEIKKYAHLIDVKVSDYSWNVVVLKYEWKQEYFFEKMRSNDFIYFPIHKKTVKTSMIIEVSEIEDGQKKFDEFFLALDSEEKASIKTYISNYNKKLWKRPSIGSMQNYLQSIEKRKKHDEKLAQMVKDMEQKKDPELSPIDTFLQVLKGKKYKIAYIVTWNVIWFSENPEIWKST